MAEGAGALVLENRWTAARARGATILGIIAGCGEKADDFHRTRSKPDGSAMIGAIRAALADAGIAETRSTTSTLTAPGRRKTTRWSIFAVGGLRRAHALDPDLLEQVDDRPHATAAGAVEAVFSLMTIQNSMLPPTINYECPTLRSRSTSCPTSRAAAEVGTVLSNSFGFGGQNACLVFRVSPDSTALLGSPSWFRENVARLRPEQRRPDPADRLLWAPGDAAQCDLWFPPKRIPLEDGTDRPVAGVGDGPGALAVRRRPRMLPRVRPRLLLGLWPC